MQVTGNNRNVTYNISIRLRADGFSFFSYDPAASPAVEVETYGIPDGESGVQTLEKAIAQSAMVGRGGGSVAYALVDGPSMQVPIECFRKEEVHALFHLTHTASRAGKIYYNILPHLEIAQIFTVDSDIEQSLCKHFPGIRFYHSHTMILEKMWVGARRGKPQLYVCFDADSLFVFCYKDGKLAYSNTFPADVADNAVYYILSVWKGLGMDVHEDSCILLGDGAAKDDSARLLARYLSHVEALSADEVFRRSVLARDARLPFDVLSLFVQVI